jgi:transcriptional regulator with XRE-family HTH domain
MHLNRSAPSRRPTLRLLAMSIGLGLVVIATGLASTSIAQTAADASASAAGGSVGFRRLSQAQYKRSIESIFGADIRVPGRFEPAVRADGLLAVGASRASVSPSGFEQYELRAREISAQALARERRATTVPCTPRSATAFDAACATTFFTQYGEALFRRPLSQRELAATLGLARTTTTRTGDFYKGLETGLSLLIASPNFIFRVERSEADPRTPGAQRLDSYSLASRVSFLLWDAPPDAELISAARSGAIYEPGGLERQVDRMIASPRFVDGVRAFFSDMLGYEQFDGLTKDQTRYPLYTSQLAADAREQALRTISNLLVTQNGDYRDLFTTRTTFLNRSLGSLYRVPVTGAGEDGWVEHTFAPEEQRAGILTLAGFLMLDVTHEVRSSPTTRGKAIREVFLCQRVPDPPGDVDFAAVQNTEDVVHATARDRLNVHQTQPACRGCHSLTDPIGLSLENYNTIGAFRSHENGALIDPSGNFDGQPFTNAVELGQRLHDSQTATNCVVRRSYEYGVGRAATRAETTWLRSAGERFTQDHYSFPALMRSIATSSAFQTTTNVEVASN